MSAVNTAPMGGFEGRLLAELKAHVASQPSPPVALAGESSRLTRRRAVSLFTAVAAAIATILLILSVLFGSQPALAQAFPLLGGRPHSLSALVKRILRAQRVAASNSWLADGRAYTFRTRVGAGYVVVNEEDELVCLVVPGFSADGASSRCKTVTRLLGPDSAGLQLTADLRGGGEAIVDLLRAGVKTTVTKSTGTAARIALRNGILTVVTREPVSIETSLNGRPASAANGRAGPPPTVSTVRSRPAACVLNSPSTKRCGNRRVSISMVTSSTSPRRPGGLCGSPRTRSQSPRAPSATSPPLAVCTS